MTDTTIQPLNYWALLEEITECRGHLIHLANAIYTLIGAETGDAGDRGPRAYSLRVPDPPAELAADEDATEWLAPVIPLRAGNG
jgi:hypothetical protein